MRACTIVARNYLPYARVLAKSFRAHHPDCSLTTLVTDDPYRDVEPEAEPFDVVHLDELLDDPAELRRMAAIYDATELATAVKPLLLLHLTRPGTPAIYLDPDIRFYGPMEGLEGLVRRHGIVLTPHTTEPMPQDGLVPTEAQILASGVYNLGFIGVSARAVEFLRWWWSRLRRHSVIDQAQMMFTDQRWVDFAPGYFDTYILRDAGYDVAYWNADTRWIARRADGVLTAAQEPLVFFHFSGFDPDTPWRLSKYQGDQPRVLLSEAPPLRELCEEYARELCHEGYLTVPAYGYGRFGDGVVLDKDMRRTYRVHLAAHEDAPSRVLEPPNPFEGDGRNFLAWLRQPWVGRNWKCISRYLYSMYDRRPELQAAFPEGAAGSEERFLDWARTAGAEQGAVPLELVPDVRALSQLSWQTTAPSRRGQPGVNVVSVQGDASRGVRDRLLLSVLSEAGIPYSATSCSRPGASGGDGFRAWTVDAPYDVNLLQVEADQVADVISEAHPEFVDGRYTIGVWTWPLQEFPSHLSGGFGFVDEVWAVSTFARDAIQRATHKPVTAVPVPITRPEVPSGANRRSLGLPDRFVFLFCFDYLANVERKNPVGLIEAFSRAFGSGDGAALVIASRNGERCRAARERVRYHAAQHGDILLMDEVDSHQHKTALLAYADCYVSLHRAEAFGHTLAEAMALGKPTIATAYSGNLDFMDEETSYLVPYQLVQVPRGCAPYPEGLLWADPDLDAAATRMREVFESPVLAGQIAKRASQYVLEHHGVSRRAAVVRERYAIIRRELDTDDAPSAAEAAETQSQGEAESAESLLDQADRLAASDPDPRAPTRHPRTVPHLRAAVLRVLDHFANHQRQVLRLLVDAARLARSDTEREIAPLRAEVDDLQRRLIRLSLELRRNQEQLKVLFEDQRATTIDRVRVQRKLDRLQGVANALRGVNGSRRRSLSEHDHVVLPSVGTLPSRPSDDSSD